MLDANKTSDIYEMSKYGKARGFLLAKKYKLPTFSNFFIIQNEEDLRKLLSTYPNQNDFCMRSDARIGDTPVGVSGKNGNRENIFEYMQEIQQKSNELGTKGVAVIYWNEDGFCPTYEIEGSFYLDYRKEKELLIDYVGKGWDGSYLSHGSACHETYRIPWNEILFFDENKRRTYRKKVVTQSEYEQLRRERIAYLTQKGIPEDIIENSIPRDYNGIDNEYFRQVINKVMIPMFDRKDLQMHYMEYIPIAQIEKGKVIVPEIILPERLRKKEKNYGGMEI